jgi:thiol-disulfide isomerase/thioredoxin
MMLTWWGASVTLFLALLCAGSEAMAGGGSQARRHPLAPVVSMAQQPQVRLVVVELYATWCTPCKKDMPRWEELRKRFYSKGVRLVAINVHESDPATACGWTGPWKPDLKICDIDGSIADELGVTKELPSTFVWSWHGDLLEQRATFEDAERTIRRFLAEHPRLLVEARSANGKPSPALKALITDELTTDGHFTVVVGKDERLALARIRRDSHAPDKEDSQRCKLGAAMSANSVLDASLIREGDTSLLQLSLTSAESECVVASSTQPYDPAAQARSVRAAVGALIDSLRRPLEKLEGLTSDRVVGSTASDRPPADQGKGYGTVHISSQPSDAIVEVDGQVVCNVTPCKARVALGVRDISLKTAGYDTRTERMTLKSGQHIDWTLTSRVGTVSLTVKEPGLGVSVDGVPFTTTPTKPLRLEPGRHKIGISGRCYNTMEKTVAVERGGELSLTFTPEARVEEVRFDAYSEGGVRVVGNVTADGIALGNTAQVLRVPICAEKVRITHPEHGVWEGRVSLRPGEVKDLRVTLSALAGMGKDPQVLYKQALVSLASGDRPGALLNLEAAVKLGATSSHALLARIYLLESRWEDCSKSGREYLLYHPSGKDARKVRGYLTRCEVGQKH